MKIFDILGPIMIGPSSSHTAGACLIAKMAANIVGGKFEEVLFELHGSFAETYKGHGTDKALLAGVMGFAPSDERLRHSFDIAKERGLKYSFRKIELPDVHPNTVKITFTFLDGSNFYVTGSSIGGGSFIIIDVNATTVNFTGDFPTLILKYNEQKGIIAFISTLLSENGYNIESLRTIKDGSMVTLILETDMDIDEATREKVLKDSRFIFTKYIFTDR